MITSTKSIPSRLEAASSQKTTPSESLAKARASSPPSERLLQAREESSPGGRLARAEADYSEYRAGDNHGNDSGPDDTVVMSSAAQEELERSRELTPEEQALQDLDHYYDIYDNPGKGGREGRDGIVSQGDLERIASGQLNEDEARQYLLDAGVPEDEVDDQLASIQSSADYLLDNPELWDQIDQANDPGDESDDKISRGDVAAEVHRRQLEQARDGELAPGAGASNRDGYEAVETSNDERNPELIAQQEQAILEGLASGQPVEFTNGNGQTEQLTVVQLEGQDGRAIYELTGADGHTFRVESELGASENRVGLARIADYYTQVPPHLRDSVDEIELRRSSDDNAAATFYNEGDRIVFRDGLENLNEEVFNHEFGHGIGYEADGQGEGFFNKLGNRFGGGSDRGAPVGWEQAVEADGQAVSDYADTNIREDFAESWAAYLEAREQGPEALARYAEEFPERFAILEEVYAGPA